MADLDVESYNSVEATSELLGRPNQIYSFFGQAAFLSLCVHQRVPIINSARNVKTMITPTPLAQGASSSVLIFDSELHVNLREDFTTRLPYDWFASIGPTDSPTDLSLRYVAKRVTVHATTARDDPKVLAAMINEIRILSNSNIRSSPHIVSLLAVSWFEGPSYDRFWPQLYLERADHGTLDRYLSSTLVSKLAKFVIYKDVLAGLEYLHANGVVSCDLKPQNILVFKTRKSGKRELSEEDVQLLPVVAKLCDFGFAVIISDYRSKQLFRARIGTWPWMSPELDLSVPTQRTLLHKSDIYTSGLILASILRNGKTPFQGKIDSQIREAKRGISACDIVLGEICSGTALTRRERAIVSMILVETLAPFPHQRVTLTQLMTQWSIAIEEILHLEFSPSRKLYKRLLYSRYPSLDLDATQPIPIPGIHYRQHRQGDISKTDLDPGVETDDGQGQKTVPLVPDFCFEFDFLPGTLPRVAINEITADLLAQLKHQMSSHSDVLYALSGCYLNESVLQYDPENALHFLSEAAAEGHEDAICVRLNIFEAVAGVPIPEIREEVAERVSKLAKAQLASSSIILSYLRLTSTQMHRQNFSSCYSWRRHFPLEYQEYIRSTDRTRNLLQALQTVVEADGSFELRSTDSGSEISSNFENSKFAITSDAFEAPALISRLTRLQNAAILAPLYSTDLTLHLLTESGADLNSCGTMPGWTPLWLSILCGNGCAAQILLRNGASASYAPGSAESVLHVLSQLDTADVSAVLADILAAIGPRMQLDPDLQVNGLTPLHATFIGWDFSHGAAASALLDAGANPTSRASLAYGEVTPIALCMQTLDYKLLGYMLSSKWVRENAGQLDARRALASAKTDAFVLILNHTKFYYMSILGRDFETSLTISLRLLIDDDMKIQLGLRHMDPSNPGDPLTDALFMSRAYVAETLIENFELATLKSVTVSRPYIQTAIERRLKRSVISLVNKGANLLQESWDKSTAMHAAAQYFPEILPDLISHLDESVSKLPPGMPTMEDIFKMKNARGFDVMSLLLLEGHRAELAIFETLRNRYALDINSLQYDIGGSRFTLPGICAFIMARTGLVPLTQLEYLLKSHPPPNLVCDNDRLTLLNVFAIGLPSGKSKIIALPGYQAFKMVLDYYPDTLDLSQGPVGRGTLFLAALNGNRTVIEMIESHVKRHSTHVPGGYSIAFSDLLNTPSDNNTFVLDAAAAYIAELTMDETIEHNERTTQLNEAIDTFKYLRERGARMGHEQRGVVIGWRMVYEALQDKDSFISGVDNICTRLAEKTGFGFIPRNWEPDTLVYDHDNTADDVIDILHADPHLDGAYCHFRVAMLIWSFDRFQLRMLNFKCSAAKLQDFTRIKDSRFRREMTETGIEAYLLSCGPEDDGDGPWTKTTYTQKVLTIPPIAALVTWIRPGRTWTQDEVMEVVKTFTKAWDYEFKDSIDRELEIGKGGFPAIFRRSVV